MDGPLEPGAYECPHCSRTYDSTWIKRHLVAKHDYKWWDNWNVYLPQYSDEIVVPEHTRGNDLLVTDPEAKSGQAEAQSE